MGKEVKLCGWVDRMRDHGKILFIDLRDRTGRVQCVISEVDEKFSEESAIEVIGKVKERPSGNVNDELETGKVEIEVESYSVEGRSKELPIPVKTDGREINEDVRLEYRYIDLRRERMQKILRMRSEFVQSLRESLFKKDFTEIETPMLTKSTREGARDFIVPSRYYPGKFYALPQSPQQYKQLLMVAGVERYFQTARCIRDEDLRADRGFEFTQLDLEMAFVDEKQVMDTVEDTVKKAVKKVGGKLRDEKFSVINYEDAMEKYGADKFDMRSEKEKKDGVLAFAWVVRFPFFKKVEKDNAAEAQDSKSGWTFTHNPFSMPIEEHKEWLMNGENIDQITTTQYDLVCNGYEAGGGSIRAHDPEVLKATFKVMGFSDAEIEESVGHMIEALSLGAPPHGGIALGIDRLVMLLAGENSLKEVIPFPMTGSGKTSVMDAPSEVSEDQLKELGLEIKVGQNTSVFERVVAKLKNAEVDFEVIKHKPVTTSEEAAEVRGTPIGDAPKAMVLKKASGGYVMVCVPADRKVDMKSVKDVVGEKVDMASPAEIESEFGVEIGGVPPFGNVLGIKMYMDRDFWSKDSVSFNAGRKDRSIKMKSSDLIKVAEPAKISEQTEFKK